ncbi:MAG: hypothetical protein ABSE25_00705 [Syntrophorhabdales bacterium]
MKISNRGLLPAGRRPVLEHTETVDILLQRITAFEPSPEGTPWFQVKRRYLLEVYDELRRLECQEPIDKPLERIEYLSFLIGTKLRGKDPYRINRLLEEAVERGLEKARRAKSKAGK